MDPDSHSPTEPPPPAYDAQEFDRKISAALDMSMDPALQTVVEEEWEEWNDEVYKTNATARSPHHSSAPSHPISRQNSKKSSYSAQSPRSQSSSSSSPYYSSPSVPSWAPGPPPSRRLPSFPPPKERPSWYAEAHLHHLPATTDAIRINRSSTPPIVHHIAPPVDDEFEDNMDEPLPPFALIGPPLEGPPYSSPHTTRSPSYYASPPRSPPPQRRSVNQPSFRQRPVATSPPLSTSSTYSSAPHLPPMPFDPGLAYGRQRQASAFMSRDEDSGPVDPSLLYKYVFFFLDHHHCFYVNKPQTILSLQFRSRLCYEKIKVNATNKKTCDVCYLQKNLTCIHIYVCSFIPFTEIETGQLNPTNVKATMHNQPGHMQIPIKAVPIFPEWCNMRYPLCQPNRYKLSKHIL